MSDELKPSGTAFFNKLPKFTGGSKMELQITGKNIELTPAVRRHVESKLGRLSRYLPNIIESRVEIFEEKVRSSQQRFVVQVTVNRSGTQLYGEGKGGDLFTAIDKVAAIIERQAERFKGKRYNKGRGSSVARGGFNEEVEPTSPRKVVKVKRFAVKPMSVAEAIDQMELLRHDFFLFFNAESEELNLLYRRKDGNYGLIEPELS
ncbi:Ribosome hibernation promotion factor [subsurface metagenome]